MKKRPGLPQPLRRRGALKRPSCGGVGGGLLFLLCCLLLSSCRSQKQVAYNPVEVIQLSREMGFPISNTDKNIPLYAEASVWLGVPYRYAGLSRKGIDCSGLVNRIYWNTYRKAVARSTVELDKTTKNTSKKNLRAGDLVFFATSSNNRKKINHVGIYLKDGYFVHASTSRGVIVSHLEEEYYHRAWKRGGRF
ncbi:C40 family peptidase [Viscerimonas tarda]